MSVIKHTDPVPDPRAVNQDKKNMLFSVRSTLHKFLVSVGLLEKLLLMLFEGVIQEPTCLSLHLLF